MKKKVKVIALVTDDNENFAFVKRDFDRVPRKGTNTAHLWGHQMFHLYLISDDEINVGDWCYVPKLDIVGHRVEKLSTSQEVAYFSSRNWGKIIATTDPTLNLSMIPESFVKSYCKNPVDEVFVNIFPTLDENFDPTEEYVVEISPVETSWNKEQLEFWLYENVSAFFDTVVTDSRKKKMQTFLSTLDDLGQRFREFQEDMKADAYKREFEDREYYNSH